MDIFWVRLHLFNFTAVFCIGGSISPPCQRVRAWDVLSARSSSCACGPFPFQPWCGVRGGVPLWSGHAFRVLRVSDEAEHLFTCYRLFLYLFGEVSIYGFCPCGAVGCLCD